MHVHARRPSTLGLFLAFSLLPTLSRAATPAGAAADPGDPAFAEATEALRRASAGEANQGPRAKALLDKLAAAAPGDPVILAYAGSAAVLVARDERSPIERMKGIDAGLDQIDLAVRLLGPDHDRPLPGRLPARVETLLVAASTFLALPDAVFHRAQEGKTMVAGVRAHPDFHRLPASVQARFDALARPQGAQEAKP
jgi:hypothetical protein